jgi:hypothetical protein
MIRFALRAVSVVSLALVTACGELPPAETSVLRPSEVAPGPSLQPISFTGVADPAAGRLQVFMEPQAAIGMITEDADGNSATVATGTAQVYGASVTFASGGVGYPAGCNTSSPWAMIASVDVRSGFTEQLRNVYARITSKSNGPTFCTIATPGAIAPPTPYVGLYFYQPLNSGTAPSAINRSVQWAMTLPDNSPYWFSGDLWAEVIPAPPADVLPANDLTYHTGGSNRYRVSFRWTDDARADGSNSGENYAVARPTGGGASISIMRCGPSSAAFDPATCTTNNLGPTRVTGGSYNRRFTAGYWYQWSLRSAFDLPGGGTTWVLGSTVITRHFAVVNP